MIKSGQREYLKGRNKIWKITQKERKTVKMNNKN